MSTDARRNPFPVLALLGTLLGLALGCDSGPREQPHSAPWPLSPDGLPGLLRPEGAPSDTSSGPAPDRPEAVRAWAAFHRGDSPAAARLYGRALDAVAAETDSSLLIPRWERYHLLRLALAGTPTSLEELRDLDARRRRLVRQAAEEDPRLREERQRLRALVDAWERGDLAQAWHLLPGPASSASDSLVRRMVLGRVAERAGRPALAAFWYRRALERVPGNPVVMRLVVGLPRGTVPERPGELTDGEVGRVLARFEERGWTALLPRPEAPRP